MSNAGKVSAIAVVLVALAWAVAPVAEAQAPIRIGASLTQTGGAAALGPDQLRGYQLCVKHVNEKGGVLGRKLDLTLYDDGSDPSRPPASMKSLSRGTRRIWSLAGMVRAPPRPWPT